MNMNEYKARVIKELMRYHEAITDYYAVTEPHSKVESDLYLHMEDIYKDVISIVKWGDEPKYGHEILP